MTSSVFAPYFPIAAIATTPQAARTLHSVSTTIGATLYIPEPFFNSENCIVYSGSLKTYLAQIWGEYKAFIFGLATGATVRLIAPLLQDKTSDPAVLVIDPQGKFVISLCGGHQGGADQLTRLMATQFDATPVLTGAANDLNLPPIDTLGNAFGWQKGSGDWTGVSAALARQETIQVIQDAGSNLWQKQLPDNHPLCLGLSESQISGRIWISATQRSFSAETDFPKVQWHPRVLWVGIGCIRGTSQSFITEAITQVFQKHHLAQDAIAGIATIDIKADEVGLLAYCQENQLPLKIFTPEQLNQEVVPTPSNVVYEEVGTASVAEASALCAAKRYGETQLLVSKQIIKTETEAVTIAIAQSEQEYIGKTGALWLIGTGPGALEQMTTAAKTAITQADVIIGYSLYLDLIQPLQRPGQIIEAYPITQERQRAQRAIALANWGLKVAVISSGDCGIYGMAGLVLEELQKSESIEQQPTVEVFPGISALQAAAARVGAPLMHDFCAISLSDLLTPKPLIEKRLLAAAQADFVTAIYNPKSQKRTELIETAQQIFLAHRKPETPVILVRSAYRSDEEITVTTLEKMLNHPIDMLTVVLIGNSTTYQQGNFVITPRGY
ncbi:MAG: precorrin-3B C(17)-methyltransferase [Snowella sp.]|nr:precorrin-3B C(17)-methyltransferase [Snowella sp.]